MVKNSEHTSQSHTPVQPADCVPIDWGAAQALFIEGNSFADIARRFGISSKRVARYAKHNNWAEMMRMFSHLRSGLAREVEAVAQALEMGDSTEADRRAKAMTSMMRAVQLMLQIDPANTMIDIRQKSMEQNDIQEPHWENQLSEAELRAELERRFNRIASELEKKGISEPAGAEELEALRKTMEFLGQN